MAKRGKRGSQQIVGISNAAIEQAIEDSAHLTPSNSDSDGFSQDFKLKSGKVVRFNWREIPASKVESDTFVEFSINGRDPNSVTPESVIDIRKTIKHNQFLPVIGFDCEKGANVLDGQRRRMAAICEQRPLKGLFAEEEISLADAKQLARDIQTAKEHNLRDLGFEVKEYKRAGLQGKEIAELMDISESKVSRADKAASVKSELLASIPDINDLIIADYNLLSNISEYLDTFEIPVEEFVSNSLEDFNSSEHEKTDSLKDAVVERYSESFSSLKKSKKPKKEGPKKTPIFNFESQTKKKAIRVDNDRVTKFEFTRLTKAQLDSIEKAVKDILSNDNV